MFSLCSFFVLDIEECLKVKHFSMILFKKGCFSSAFLATFKSKVTLKHRYQRYQQVQCKFKVTRGQKKVTSKIHDKEDFDISLFYYKFLLL